MEARTQEAAGSAKERRLHEVVLGDLKRADLKRSLRRDLQDLYDFYLDDERRERLEAMGRPKSILWLIGWTFKSLVLKLSPARRLMLLLAVAVWGFSGSFAVRGFSFELNLRLPAFLLLLLVLMLELKDKLLARDEIEVARQVQLALLPVRHPQPDGWSVWSFMRPANDVGGDLVDYLEPGPGRVGVALGDVAGKGLGAALLMSKLQATLRAVAPACVSLAELGARLNAILHRDGLPNRFATLFYLEIAPGSGRVRYLNAGHNPAYLLRADSGARRVESLGASALPLGMMPDAVYAEGQASMAPGDVLVAYSDGLTEARDAADEEFGAARLLSLLAGMHGLPPQEAGDRIVAEVNRFLGDAPPHDDLSLVVLRRQP